MVFIVEDSRGLTVGAIVDMRPLDRVRNQAVANAFV